MQVNQPYCTLEQRSLRFALFSNSFKIKLYFSTTTKNFSTGKKKSCIHVINCLDICLGTVLLSKCLSSEKSHDI